MFTYALMVSQAMPGMSTAYENHALPKIPVTLNLGFPIYFKDWWSYFQSRPEEEDIQKASPCNHQ